MTAESAGSNSTCTSSKDTRISVSSDDDAVIVIGSKTISAFGFEVVIDPVPVASYVFIFLTGLTVGSDVSCRTLWNTMTEKIRAFSAGVACQFGLMPLFGFALSYIVPESDAFCNRSSLALAVLLPGCMPGGTASNLMCLLINGNQELSILMSIVSNVAAVFMIPLLLTLYHESRYEGDTHAIHVPYMSIMIPLFVFLGGVISGILLKACAFKSVVRCTQIFCATISILFLLGVSGLGIYDFAQAPFYTTSIILTAAAYQPMGYIGGFLVGRFIFRLTLRDSLTVCIETGVQNWALGMAIAFAAFDSEEDTGVLNDVVVNGVFGPYVMYTLHCVWVLIVCKQVTKKAEFQAEIASKGADDSVHDRATPATRRSRSIIIDWMEPGPHNNCCCFAI